MIEMTEPLPSAAIVLPFELKMTPRGIWEPTLKPTLRKVEKELMAKCSSDRAMPLITKLQSLFNNLNTATHKRSIAVFVSPIVEKVMYMDMPVEEKVLVNTSFRVRDLTNCRKKGMEYLVLLLGTRQSKMYKSEGAGLRLIKANAPQNIEAFLNEAPEREADGPDSPGRREAMLNRFLHHMDTGLSFVLKAYPLPVFVLGDSRIAGHFSKITRNDKRIVAYIHKNCQEAGEQQLLNYMQPYIMDWQELRQQYALRQAEKAHNAGKLAMGLHEVGKMAKYKRTAC